MDIDEHIAQDHPEELLAAYVEGSATADERRAVDSHVTSCGQCRSEIELATSARAALASLPELEAPGLAKTGLEAFRQPADRVDEAWTGGPATAGPAPGRVRQLGGRIHWDRVALGAGLAAAAGLFVIFVAIGVFRGTGGRSGVPSQAGANGTALPQVIDRSAAYSPASLQALAARLRAPAEQGRLLSKAPDGSFAGIGGSSGPQPSPASDAVNSTAALSCLHNATGLLPTAKPIYLESANFHGVPAFIGAFVVPPPASGAGSHLIVAAVSRNGCQPLYEVRESL